MFTAVTASHSSGCLFFQEAAVYTSQRRRRYVLLNYAHVWLKAVFPAAADATLSAACSGEVAGVLSVKRQIIVRTDLQTSSEQILVLLRKERGGGVFVSQQPRLSSIIHGG